MKSTTVNEKYDCMHDKHSNMRNSRMIKNSLQATYYKWNLTIFHIEGTQLLTGNNRIFCTKISL